MSKLIPAQQEESMVNQPEFSIDIFLPEKPMNNEELQEPTIDVALWPFKDSDYHQSASISFEEALKAFIDDNIIPDGSARQEYKYNLLYGLSAIEKIISEAKNRVENLPVREMHTKSKSKP